MEIFSHFKQPSYNTRNYEKCLMYFPLEKNIRQTLAMSANFDSLGCGGCAFWDGYTREGENTKAQAVSHRRTQRHRSREGNEGPKLSTLVWF